MSLYIIKQQIEKFLSNDEPEVFAIKGAWGVGKTYTWNKFIIESKENKKIALNKYSYVSLFGINTIEALKYSIFENLVSRELIGTEPNLETFRDNATGLLGTKGRKWLSIFKNITFIRNFSHIIDGYLYLSVTKTIICIDDLERVGNGLAIKDVMGLVTQLKEQKDCKVVFLLNDKELDHEHYHRFREKVVDIEMEFLLTPKECAEIAFDPNNRHLTTLATLTEKLNIRNIRVLKKIDRLVKDVQPYLHVYEPEFIEELMHSLVLLTWSNYSASEGAPPLGFIKNIGFNFWGIGEEAIDKDLEGGDRKRWKTLIQEYGYTQTDELDLVLADAVESGFLNQEKFILLAKEKNTALLNEKARGSLRKVWDLYHNSFDNNQEELVFQFMNAFKKNPTHVTLTNLNGIVTLFRGLGEDKKASELIDLFIQAKKGQNEIFNLEKTNFFGDQPDDEIVNKFNAIFQDSLVTENISVVLNRIMPKNGWSPKDESVLAQASTDDYYQVFKAEKGDHLASFVQMCLSFGRFANASPQQQLIANKAIDALKRIANENDLNKMRVRKFGIEIA